MNGDHDKVFTYLDLLNFSNSLKICIKLCNSLNENYLAQQISKFISEKEQKEIIQKEFDKSKPKPHFDSQQVSMCMQM
jgi:hypothetical protein